MRQLATSRCSTIVQLGLLACMLGGLGCQREYFVIHEPVLEAARQRAMQPTGRTVGVPVHRVDMQEQRVARDTLQVDSGAVLAQDLVPVQGASGGPLAGQLLLVEASDLRSVQAAGAQVPVQQAVERRGTPVAVRLDTLDLPAVGRSEHGRALVQSRAVNRLLVGGIVLSAIGLPLLGSGIGFELAAALTPRTPGPNGIVPDGPFVEAYTAPAMVLGTLTLAAGVTMIAIGARRHRHLTEAPSADFELSRLDIAATAAEASGAGSGSGSAQFAAQAP